MKRKLLTSQALKDFEGNIITEDHSDVTLKKILVNWLMQAHQAKLSNDDNNTLYGAGILIGSSTGEVVLDQKQYDALKRLVDKAGEIPLSPILISVQTKELVDAAETIKD